MPDTVAAPAPARAPLNGVNTPALSSFTWDEERLQALYRSLSREMAREVRAMTALEAADESRRRSASVA